MARILYTHRGFPVFYNAPGGSESTLYENPRMTELAAALGSPIENTDNFVWRRQALIDIAKELNFTGGFFQPLLEPNVRVSHSVLSYVKETLELLCGTRRERLVSHPDWWILLQSVPHTDHGQTVTPEVLRLIEQSELRSPVNVVQRWVSRKGGFDDLVLSMRLFSGLRDSAV